MKQFFKFMFASMVGTILTFAIAFLLMMGFVASVASFSAEKEVVVPEKTVLHLKFDKPITDRTPKMPFEEFGFFADEKPLGLDQIIENLEKAKKDGRIKGLYLELSVIPTGKATIEELRNAMLDFKESGKFIIVYSEVMNQSAYYIASTADKIYMNPEGFFDFRGYSAQLMFFKGMLEKLEIEPQIVKVGTYKSAVEPLFLDKMSKENREQVKMYMQSMWDHYVSNISKSRNIPVDKLNLIADSILVQSTKDAVKYGLIDGVKYYDEVEAEIKEKVEIEKDKKLKTLTMVKYARAGKGTDELRKRIKTKDKIAVIYAIGDIQSGEGDDQTIGSERIAKAICKARKDSTVKAIVMRVNSPGGSALASEVILREAILAKETKPFVVSMGDVAASGGYYISCHADKIYAHENTITGSIGVFGVMMNVQKFLNNKLGITIDTVNTNLHSDFGTPFRSMNEYERRVIQNYVDKTYETFVAHVAEGRKMAKEEVDKIGQGRVWSGVNAKEIGLIDEFGGLDDAIAGAAKLAGTEDYKVVNYPKQKNPLEEIFSSISENSSTKMLQKELGENYIYYKHLKDLTKMEGVQARLPYNIVIE